MKGWLQKYLFWVLLGVLAMYWFYRQWPHSIAVNEIMVQQNNGSIASLNISKDSITIVHFYAHWCGPCMRELPEIAEQKKAFQQAGISIICVTDDDLAFIDDISSRTQLKIFKTPSLKDLKVFSIPMTYIYDAKGNQVKRIEGPFEWSNPSSIEEILKHKEP